MAKLDRLRTLVRVFGRGPSGNVYVGSFAAWLPQVPDTGWVLNASQLDEVDWKEPTNESFKAIVASKQVTYGDALVVKRVSYQLDDDGSCDEIRVDTLIDAIDPTTTDTL